MSVCDSCYRAHTYPGAPPPPPPPAPEVEESEELSEKDVESVAHSVAQSVAESLARSVQESALAAAARRREEARAYAEAIANPPDPVIDVDPLEAGSLTGDLPMPEPPTDDESEEEGEAVAQDGATEGVTAADGSAADGTTADGHQADEPEYLIRGELFQGPPVKKRSAERSRPRITDAPDPALVPAEVLVGRPSPTDTVGRVLAAAENRGVVWLGPRITPEGVTVDHVALSPNGVWLVKVETADGRIERRDVGDWFTAEPRLSVNGRDRTEVVLQIHQTEHSVARAVVGSPIETLPIYQVICFEVVAPGWIDRPFEFDGVWVTWSHNLIEPMLATVHMQRPEIARMASILDRLLTRI